MTPWLFAYGSLIWRPTFPYEERLPARVSGWARRFWQGSVDHRGVPGAPGRVVTLVPAEDEVCEGVAYRVPEARLPEILEHLDHREKGGYERLVVPAEAGGRRLDALLFVAGPDNPQFLGPAPLEEIARQVVDSHGPSGANAEYVLELARALRDLGVRDPHVHDLEGLVRHRIG